MKDSKIEWTDHTFNPWEGCTKVSPGCAHCYAETRNARWHGGKAPNWGPGAPRRRTSEANWQKPLRWKWEGNICDECGQKSFSDTCVHGNCEGQTRRQRVFCASLADWLDDEVPLGWLCELLNLIRLTPSLDWQLLTKRPENWSFRINQVGWVLDDKPDTDHCCNALRSWLADWMFSRRPPANVWIGTTVEDQQRADERIPTLLEIPARVRFLSCEPLLETVDLSAFIGRSCSLDDVVTPYNMGIDWVIAGGESGPGSRPMNPDWARYLRDQCAAAEVSFFFKQWGDWADGHPEGFTERASITEKHWPGGGISVRCGKKAAGRLLDGRTHDEFPN